MGTLNRIGRAVRDRDHACSGRRFARLPSRDAADNLRSLKGRRTQNGRFGLKTTTGIIAAVLVTAALAQASRVFAPLAAALFIIAIVWPVQKQLQSWMPKLAALAITIVATVAVCLGFASLAAWGFGRVGRSLVGDLPRYQALYSAMVTWLDGHGISVAGLWAEHFNVGWLLRATQYVTTRVNTTLSFWVIVLIYVMLGLLEVENIRQNRAAG